jgi:hypothetical protein
LLILLQSKEVDDVVYEVDCQLITIKPGADVDIGQFCLLFLVLGSILEFFQGANPSAEEQEEALEDGAVQVNNIVHSFRLQQSSFDKANFVKYLKVFIPVCFGPGIW